MSLSLHLNSAKSAFTTKTLKGRVLLVEDDELTATWLLKALRQKGVTADWVRSRDEAQQTFSKTQYHAVITDIYLDGGKSGLEFLNDIEASGIPVIVITCQADLDIAKQSLNHGASHLLEKPFEAETLFEILEKIWEEPRGLTSLVERYLEINHLTPKEKEIARFVLKGLSNREIASVMGNTEKTIKFHLTVIFQKCGVKSRTEFFNAIFPT